MQLQSNPGSSPGKKDRKNQSNANTQMASNGGAMSANGMGTLQQMGPNGSSIANPSGAS